MKTFAAIAVAGLIAGAGVLWFLSNPVVVTAKIAPLKPSAAIPTFKSVQQVMPRQQDIRAAH